jgi:ribose transport system permease protein
MRNDNVDNDSKKSVGVLKKVLSVIKFKEANILIALVVLCLFFYFMNNVFFIPANLQIISRWMSNFALLGIGETLVIITGGIDLSLGSMVAFTNMLVAYLMVDMGLPIWLSIIIVLSVSCLIGLFHGVFVTKLRVPAFIITLGTLMWARGLASYIKRGWIISGLPESFLFFGQGKVFGIPFQFLVLIVIALIVAFILRFTALGRYIFAVGGNIEAARLSGVHIDRVRIFCYMASSFIAGITGIIIASRLSEGNPATGGSWELWAIAASVIGGTSLFGGRGTILGTVIGASIMGVVVNGMVLIRVSSYLQDVVLGVILIIAVTYDTIRRRKEL